MCDESFLGAGLRAIYFFLAGAESGAEVGGEGGGPEQGGGGERDKIFLLVSQYLYCTW